jgi:hypothetical protein
MDVGATALQTRANNFGTLPQASGRAIHFSAFREFFLVNASRDADMISGMPWNSEYP